MDLLIPGIFTLKYLHVTEASDDGVWDESFESSDFIYSACVHLVLKNSNTLEELHIGGKLWRFFEIFHFLPLETINREGTQHENLYVQI